MAGSFFRPCLRDWRDRLFFFAGYEALRERLGKTIQTVVPDENARGGFLPDPANPGSLIDVGVYGAMAPYLAEFPLPNGANRGGGTADFNFPFTQRLSQHFVQFRLDRHIGGRHQIFGRYTHDYADQLLPTDYPQFPRYFRSRNQFLTTEYRQITSASVLNTVRFGVSRTRVWQDVEANVTNLVQPFVPGRDKIGSIDIGGFPRFGIIAGPTFPVPPFERGVGNTMRPVQYDLENPRIHMWNASVQREVWPQTVVTVGYAGSRGRHLLRSGDVNIPTPQIQADGRAFFPPGAPRANRAWGTIELKSSDGNSWYKALILEVRRRWSAGFSFQSSYTLSSSVDTTQASTFFSDATNGTTSAFPEVGDPHYNKGPSDFDARHNWVLNFSWDIPFARGLTGPARAVLDGWRLAGIANVRSGGPLTVFVSDNRSRSQWSPSLNPGAGRDRASLAPGRSPESAVLGRPQQWFDPSAFVLQPVGFFGDSGRGAFRGPDLRTVDLAASKHIRWGWLGEDGVVELRVETFNLFNRANFGPPALIAFAGVAEREQPLPSFGRIRTTITSARQIQLGVRVVF